MKDFLQQSKAVFDFLKDTYQSTALPVIIIDKEFKVLSANEIAYSFFPLFSQPDGIKNLLSDYNLSVVTSHLEEQHSFNAVLSRPPFSNLEITISALYLQGVYIGAVVNFIGRWKENQTLHSSNSENTLLAINREFRDPLSMIFSTLSLLSNLIEQQDLKGGDELIEIISRNCYKMLRSTVNVSQESRLNVGTYDLELKNVNINMLVSNVVNTVCLLGNRYNTPISYIDFEHDLFTRADDSKLILTLLNIILNSLKYTRENNSVVIRLSQRNDRAVISVTDTGVGIPANILPQVYQPYFSYNHNGIFQDGLGLGLTLARNIIIAHDGTISLFSREGIGTTVAFSLPIGYDATLPDMVMSSPIDFLKNRFSPIYVQLCEVCDFPLS